MEINDIVYVGVNRQVLALDRQTGTVIWKTAFPRRFLSLSSDSFVNVLFERGSVFAHADGKLYCLDAATGHVKWENSLKGCGHGIATLATATSSTTNLAAINRKKQDATAATVVVAAAVIAGADTRRV
jgi:outer membrane protein assembly factor BamB